MPDKSKYDLDSRPESYWKDAQRMLLANIKGEERRKEILTKAREGRIEEIPSLLIAENLPDELREHVGAINLIYMGGEYLPDSETEEIEIARVSLQSVMGDVISIRATPEEDGIRYRIVDEYDNLITCTPEHSKAPLTFGELIDLIDNAEFKGYPGRLTFVLRDSQLDAYRPCGAEELSKEARNLVDFLTLTSVFYPQLEQWYYEEAEEWFQERTRQSDDEDS